MRAVLLAGAVVAASAVGLTPAQAAATTWIVNDAGDAGDGCDLTDCTLREAILAANASDGPDEIGFALTGGAPYTIAPTSPLPPVTSGITIDATTQSEFTGKPIIVLNGDSVAAGDTAIGLQLTGTLSALRGLIIQRWKQVAVQVSGAQNTIAGNWIGTDTSGTTAQLNGFNFIGGTTIAGAVQVLGDANTIGGDAVADRNVISGNYSAGVEVTGAGNTVRNNYIGMTATGTGSLGNDEGGVVIGGMGSGAANTVLDNLISGNGADGVVVRRNGTIVRGNLIGTNVDQTDAQPNNGHGVLVLANDVRVGGPSIDDDNVIAHNTGDGVHVGDGGTSNGNSILGNSIHDNVGDGINLEGGANNNQAAPIITQADSNSATAELTSTPNALFTIQVYTNSACDAGGNGEGAQLVDMQSVTTDGTGAATVNFIKGPFSGVLTATATRRLADDDLTPSDTSEFSACRTVDAVPTAVSESYTTNEETPLNVDAANGVLANDTNAVPGTLTAEFVSGTSHGTLVLQTDGSFDYIGLQSDFFGTDSFVYRAKDSTGALSNPVTVTITVDNVDDTPDVTFDSYTLDEDMPLTVAAPGLLANDSDVDGDTLTAGVETQPTFGSVTVNGDGSFTYTPNANYHGGDSFGYEVTDGHSAALGSVMITVNPVDDVPVAVGDNYSTNEDTPLTVVAPGLLVNDSDVEGAALTSLFDGEGNATDQGGTVTVNLDGSFSYTPPANFTGTDTFTYVARDPSAVDSDPATVTIAVGAVNDLPVAADDNYTATAGSTLTIDVPGVLGNDTDPDGDSLTTAQVTGPTNGTLTLNPDGSFTYTPAANYVGPDSFTYTANDAGPSAPATVTITVGPANQVPVGFPDSYLTAEDTPLTVAAPGVLGNDNEPDGDTLTAALGAGPVHGTLTLNPDGSFTYTPTADYNGPDSFTYTASDGSLTTAPVTVTLSVTPVDEPPVPTPGNEPVVDPTGTSVTLPIPGAPGGTTTATSSDPSALPNSSLVITGTGPNRTLTIEPGPGARGRSTVTVTTAGGGTITFVVTVGTQRSELIRGTKGDDVIFGLGGNDVIQGKGGDDILIGGTGNDVLKGGTGGDSLFGGPGDDVLKGDADADHFDGGPGRDQEIGLRPTEGDTSA